MIARLAKGNTWKSCIFAKKTQPSILRIIAMVNINEYIEVKDCIYKDEHYSARYNGAIMRHQREGLLKSCKFVG